MFIAGSIVLALFTAVAGADVVPISQIRQATAFGTLSTPDDFDTDTDRSDAPDFELFDDTVDIYLNLPGISATGTASHRSYLDHESFFFIASIHGEAMNEVEGGFAEGFGGAIFNYDFSVDVPTTFVLTGELFATGGGGSHISFIGTEVIFQYSNYAQGTVPVYETHTLEPGVMYRFASNTGGFGQAYDDFLIVADGSVTLEAFFSPSVSVADDRYPIVTNAFPNPTRESVNFDIAAGGSGAELNLSIYDAAGRLIRSLPVRGARARWDGLSSAGERVAPGVYFYRTDAPGNAAPRRLVVID